jgi:hypothetical protein
MHTTVAGDLEQRREQAGRGVLIGPSGIEIRPYRPPTAKWEPAIMRPRWTLVARSRAFLSVSGLRAFMMRRRVSPYPRRCIDPLQGFLREFPDACPYRFCGEGLPRPQGGVLAAGDCAQEIVDRSYCLAGGSAEDALVDETAYFFGRDFIELLVVDPAVRRAGIDRVLLRQALAIACTSQVFTSTNTSNQAMRSLLRAEGWSLSGELDGLDEGDPELVFYKARPAKLHTSVTERLADLGAAI